MIRSKGSAAIAQAARTLRLHPWLVPAALTLLAYAVIRPWGEFPLNDDWTFSRVAKKLAETGRFFVDVPSGPSLVLQSLAGAALIKVFGFSHLLMRLLTMAIGFAGLWAIDALLARASVAWGLRLAALLTVAFNPLYLYLSSTFMTELYGHVPALIGVVLWFRGRARADETRPSGALIPWPEAIGAAALIGATFWTRQYASFAFPAVWGTAVLHAWYQHQRARLRASVAPLGGSFVIFVAVVAAYFPWAIFTGNFRREFGSPLKELWRFNGQVSLMQTAILLFYLTAFFLPMLLLFRWSGRRQLAMFALAGAISIGVATAALGVAERFGRSNMNQMDPQHRVFPFASNVLYNAGIGPITLNDAYFWEVPRPAWPLARWKAIQWFLVVAAAAWAPAAWGLRSAARRLKGRLGWEVMMYGLLFGLGSFAVTVQASKVYVYDRYYIPTVIGLALCLGALLQANREQAAAGERIGPIGGAVFTAALAPLALFSVLGIHDQFRWNEVRWQLVDRAMAAGADVGNVDGGYEVNGWLNVDNLHDRRMPRRCIGPCQCASEWFCSDASFTISLGQLEGYDVASSGQPNYWLAPGPPLLLLRRQGPW